MFPLMYSPTTLFYSYFYLEILGWYCFFNSWVLSWEKIIWWEKLLDIKNGKWYTDTSSTLWRLWFFHGPLSCWKPESEISKQNLVVFATFSSSSWLLSFLFTTSSSYWRKKRSNWLKKEINKRRKKFFRRDLVLNSISRNQRNKFFQRRNASLFQTRQKITNKVYLLLLKVKNFYKRKSDLWKSIKLKGMRKPLDTKFNF